MAKAEAMNTPMPGNLFDESIGYEDLRALSLDARWEERVSEQVEALYGLAPDEMMLVEDALKYTLDYFRLGAKSIAALPTFDKDQGEQFLIQYVHVLRRTVEGNFGQSFAPTVYSASASGLRVIALELIPENDDIGSRQVRIESSRPALEAALQQVNEYLKEQRSLGLFVRRHIRCYIGNIIYVIKPDERRFWTQSSGLRDADEIYTDIMQAWRSSL